MFYTPPQCCLFVQRFAHGGPKPLEAEKTETPGVFWVLGLGMEDMEHMKDVKDMADK